MKPLTKYFGALFLLHKSVFIWPLNQFILSKSIKVSVAAANFKFFLERSNLRVAFDHESNLFCIKDGGAKHFFGDLKRGLDLYGSGLNNRASKLFDSYLLGAVKFSDNDVVLDCGANYADLWLSLSKVVKEGNYITFEPGLREHLSIKKNAPNGVHLMKGLSNKDAVVTYYVNERNADSSIIEPVNFTHTEEIKTTTLQKYFKENRIEKIKLFKLEAEGFEPEILEGASSVLDAIEYIALDGGYERGKDQTETFSTLCNTLHDHGFKMVSINFTWARALFVNRR